MKLKLFTSIAFLGLFLSVANVQANIDEKMRKERVVRGIIIKDGKETEGYIKKKSETRTHEGVTYSAFDNFQSDISFIPKEEFETAAKITNKMYTKYDPKMLDGYKYIYETGNMLTYESVKYSDKSAVSLRMIPQQTFLRVESNGKITVYSFYSPLPKVMVGNEAIKQAYEATDIQQIVYRRAGETASPKMIELMNLEKELADCPKIVERYKSGEYNVVGKSKFMNALNKAGASDKMKYTAIVEYNSGVCDEE